MRESHICLNTFEGSPMQCLCMSFRRLLDELSIKVEIKNPEFKLNFCCEIVQHYKY